MESTTGLSNKRVNHSTLWQTERSEAGWERVTSHKQPHSDSEVLGLGKSSRINTSYAGPSPSDVKQEDVLEDISATSFTLLPDAAEEAMLIILHEKKSVCIFYNVHPRDLLEAPDGVAGGLLEGEVDLLLTNPPYNVRNKCTMDNSLHDISTHQEMSHFCGVGASLNGWKDTLTCFLLLDAVSEWYRRLEPMQQEVTSIKADSEAEVTMRRRIFEVKSVPLYYTQAQSNN